LSALSLKRIFQRELNQPRRADGGCDRRRSACRRDGSQRRNGERWVIEQVEKVRTESEALPLRQPECLIEREVDVFLRRPDDAVAGSVAVNCRVTRRTVGKRR